MALPLLAAGMGRLIAARAIQSGEILAAEFLESLGEEIEANLKRTEITVPVASSAIRSISYHVGGIITVEFLRGGSYDYMGSEDMFIAFVNAPSKGQFFNAHFR